jgi:hypothetical protein
MAGHIFIAPGDITQLGADAIAFSASRGLSTNGNLYSSFQANVPSFAPWYNRLRHTQETPCDPGSTFWLPLDPKRRPHGVVVVVATGGGPSVGGLAVRNTLTVAVRRIREEMGRTGRLLVALPAFRLGFGGDRHQRLASARTQLAAARDALETLPDVDAAFIPYTDALYQIFLQARREELGGPGEGPCCPGLERALRERQCVLFVGAGLSSGAGLPDWDGLVRKFADDLGLDTQTRVDHLDLAQWYRDRFGAARLGEVVRDTFVGAGLPTLAHYLLMALPVRHVITTNYDDLLERALSALKRHPVPVVRQEEVARTGGSAGVYVVKLHGDANHPDDVVLSRDDYHQFFERRPAMALLLEGLLLNQTFFFVGYGLRDPNFRQVFSRIARMLREARRPAFATTFEAGGAAAPYLTEQWRRQQLHLIPVGGADNAERAREFLLFLDRLADRVTLQESQLLLAPDVPIPPHLETLYRHLEQAGAAVQTLASGAGAGAGDVPQLADVLAFLTAHGWRPRGAALSPLWEGLAKYADDPSLRRRLLIAALGSAEAFADARRIRERLAELEAEDHPAPGGSDDA